MRLFLYEYLSASGLTDSDPLSPHPSLSLLGGKELLTQTQSLRREGWAMLSALAEDFAQVPGVTLLTAIDEHAPHALGDECLRVLPGAEREGFQKQARWADFTLIIAPEFDDLLAERSAWALAAGSRLLGSTPDAIREVSDKGKLGETLASYGVATPRNVALLPTNSQPEPIPTEFPLLCKPRFGAGCRGIRWIEDATQLTVQVAAARAEAPGTDLLLQRHVAGQAVSVAFLLAGPRSVSLPAGYQAIRREENGFTYAGGKLPLEEPLQARAITLGERAIACFSGLNGYVGVDLILGEAADGSEDLVIEINPRPTMAYVGLRQLCRENLAALWWRLVQGKAIVPPSWHPSSLTFTPDGMITV